MNMELLREWMQAEIALALAENERDEEGYTTSAPGERLIADVLFQKLCAAVESATAARNQGKESRCQGCGALWAIAEVVKKGRRVCSVCGWER